MMLLLPITLPAGVIFGWIGGYLLAVAFDSQEAELGYSLFFAAFPAAMAFLVGCLLCLLGLTLVKRHGLALATTFNVASFLLGLLLYNAPLL